MVECGEALAGKEVALAGKDGGEVGSGVGKAGNCGSGKCDHSSLGEV